MGKGHKIQPFPTNSQIVLASLFVQWSSNEKSAPAHPDERYPFFAYFRYRLDASERFKIWQADILRGYNLLIFLLTSGLLLFGLSGLASFAVKNQLDGWEFNVF